MQDIEKQSYLALGRTGKSSWIRYVLGSILIILAVVLIQIPVFIVLQVCNALTYNIDKLLTDRKAEDFAFEPNFQFIGLEFSFIAWFLAILLVVRFIHGRSLLSLITTSNSVNFKLIFQAAKTWFCLNTIRAGITWVVFPHAYQSNFNMQEFLGLLLAALVFIPIQALTEELFFRGYLLQGLSPLFKNKCVLSVASSIPFALAHLDLSQHLDMLLYMSLGALIFAVIMSLVTIRTKSLESAIGAHTANNLFYALIVNTPHPVLKTSAIFRQTGFSLPLELVMDSLTGLAFYYFMVRAVRKTNV